MVDVDSFPRTSLGAHLTPAPSVCLYTANPSPLPESVLWSLSLSTQHPSTPSPHWAPADSHLGLRTQQGSQDLLHRSLCSGCCEPAAALSSEPLKLPFDPAGLPLEKGLARVREAFFFHSSLPGMQVLSPLLFFCFFHPTWLCGYLSCKFGFMRLSASIQQVFCDNCTTYRCIFDLLGWPKASFSVFHKMLRKNPKEPFGQPNICGRRWTPCPSVPASWSVPGPG